LTDGGALRGAGALHRDFHAARVAAARPDLRFHDLRHTGASMATQAGATLAEVMHRLGHSTAVAAMRYQHATDERDVAIAAALSTAYDRGGNVIPLRARGATN
jgi:integrase